MAPKPTPIPPGSPVTSMDEMYDMIGIMLRVGSVVLGVSDVRRAAAFWMEALGYVPRDEIEDDWVVLIPANGTGVQVALNLSETPVQEHPRVHLDLYAGDAADQAAEVERLVALGAHHVDWDLYPEDADFVVLADPEGNRFCVIDTGHD
jgi:predicted enzyme related to lactoylglutathione lyase